MAKFGYSRSASFGAVAAGGTLGILIPPSGPMILYAVIADASIGALFIAGILPGLLMALLFSIWCMVSMRGVAREERAGAAELARALRRAFWPLAMPPVVLGGIYFGVFTATEAAAVGALLAWIIGALLYRSLSLRDMLLCAYDTVRTTSMLFLILAGAAMFGHVVTLLRLPMTLMESVTALDVGAAGFVLIVMAVVFVLGMFLETISIILVTTPLILPAMAHYGIDPVWYGVLLMINLELALITPPVGMNLFVIKAIVDAPIAEVISGSLPYVVLMVVALGLVFAFPPIATWLPALAGFE
jgi:C4-dicarboxylate transporter DctM subunit